MGICAKRLPAHRKSLTGMMGRVSRPRLTVAAEVAGIGAFIIAAVALALTLFSGSAESPSPSGGDSAVSSGAPADEERTNSNTPKSAESQGWVSQQLDQLGNMIDEVRQGTPGLVLVLLAAGVCVGIFFGALVLDSLLDAGEPWSIGLSLVASTGVLAGIYTWFFWPALTGLGLAALIASLALTWLIFARMLGH